MHNLMPIIKWKTMASEIPEQEIGKFSIKKKVITKGSMLNMNGVLGYNYSVFLNDCIITTLEEYDDKTGKHIIWMSDSPSEYYSMWELNALTEPPKVLIGGLGLGLLTYILSKRNDITDITVIEKYNEVIEMVKPTLSKFIDKSNINIIQDDFIQYVHKSWINNIKYDTIIVDIFTGIREIDNNILEDVIMVCEDYTSNFPDTKIIFWKYQKEIESNKILYYVLEKLGNSIK